MSNAKGKCSTRQKIYLGLFSAVTLLVVINVYKEVFIRQSKERHERQQAHDIWLNLNNSGKLNWCSESGDADIHQWGPNIISVAKVDNNLDWAKAVLHADKITDPDWYNLSKQKRDRFLTALVSCYAEGWAVIYDDKMSRLAEVFLQDHKSIRGNLFPRTYIMPSQPENRHSKKCKSIETDGNVSDFFSRTLMRVEDGGNTIYVNSSWQNIPAFQKEKILEYLGSCGDVSYTYFYDGYSGKKLGRYLPLIGASLMTD